MEVFLAKAAIDSGDGEEGSPPEAAATFWSWWWVYRVKRMVMEKVLFKVCAMVLWLLSLSCTCPAAPLVWRDFPT